MDNLVMHFKDKNWGKNTVPIMSPNCCKYFVNSRTPNRKNSRPTTPANTATGIFAALIRLMKSELTEI